MRADSAVEPTKSENMTVTWRRSPLGVEATSAGISPLASVRKAAMASSSLRRWPMAPTPMSFRSSAVKRRRTVSSISFSRNAAAYRSRPRLWSHSVGSMVSPVCAC